MTRFYSRQRRAWTPRMWPMVVADVVIILPLSLFVVPTLLGRIGAGLFVGGFVGVCRWELWRWMHPPITMDEYVNDFRRAAPWN